MLPVRERSVGSRWNVRVVVVGRKRARGVVPTDLAHGDGPGGWTGALRQNVLNNLMRRLRAGVGVGNPKKGAPVTYVTTAYLCFFRGFVVAWRDGRAIIDFRVQHERDRTGERAAS